MRALLLAPKTRNVLLALLLGALGFWVGPADLAPGAYTATIRVDLAGKSLAAVFPFDLGRSDGAAQTVREAGESVVLEVAGQDAYPLALGESIAYEIRVLDKDGQPVPLQLGNATSVITGPGYEQALPPTARTADGLSHTMRVPFKGRVTMALLLVVAFLWLTEVVPLAAASLFVPVAIVVAGVTDAGTVLEPFFHPIVVLFLAGFLLAEGMRRTGVDRLVALTILRRASLEPAALMLTMMALSAFLSMWMSNTASVALLIPIAMAMLDRLPAPATGGGFRRALILGIAYAATIGGIGSAIGTPANILAMTFLSEFAGTSLGFVDWFAYGLPVVLLMVPIMWVYLLLTFRVQRHHVGAYLDHEVYAQEIRRLGPLRREQWLLLLTFAAILLLWLTDRWHGVSPTIVALGGVVFLFFTDTIKKEDLNAINWNALLTFGGGLALGSMLALTGISDWIALKLTVLSQLPALLVVFLVGGLTLVIGALISNTACAAMLIPLAIPLARLLGLDPRLLVAVVAIGSSIDFALVVGTPPTMMAYSTGLFQTREIFRRGMVLDLIGLVLLSFVVVWIWRLLGVVTF